MSCTECSTTYVLIVLVLYSKLETTEDHFGFHLSRRLISNTLKALIFVAEVYKYLYSSFLIEQTSNFGTKEPSRMGIPTL